MRLLQLLTKMVLRISQLFSMLTTWRASSLLLSHTELQNQRRLIMNINIPHLMVKRYISLTQ